MEGTYSARQESARSSQSACTPALAPTREASAATPESQSTVVPKTSNVRARTSLSPAGVASSSRGIIGSGGLHARAQPEAREDLLGEAGDHAAFESVW